ncbi:MAG: phosphoribosyltransferase family protein [Gammaproteobacteria bacterium]|nr:phosphoribosyltransferase family protein [Gammaproteobacteria bacterium]MDH5628765.1 phosphoribosyltransferase family protein [Gammaproteobacteria bacterium]
MDKVFISAEDLLNKSFELGIHILKSGFKPEFIVGIWRGGTPTGIAVQEIMEYYGVKTDHIAIRTSSYIGMQQQKKVKVHGLEYIIDNIESEDNLLIVDDVFDSGRSIDALLKKIKIKCRKNTPSTIKVATVYYKPNNNVTNIQPDFYLEETDEWLVFPHELVGCTEDEIKNQKGLDLPKIDISR